MAADWRQRSNLIDTMNALPPWQRLSQSPLPQTCVGADTINLGPDLTYLNQVTPNVDGTPYMLALPDGNYLRQTKTIYVLGSAAAATAPWLLTGTFAGFNSLLFNTTALEAVLEWDGSAWHLIGGTAQISL